MDRGSLGVALVQRKVMVVQGAGCLCLRRYFHFTDPFLPIVQPHVPTPSAIAGWTSTPSPRSASASFSPQIPHTPAYPLRTSSPSSHHPTSFARSMWACLSCRIKPFPSSMNSTPAISAERSRFGPSCAESPPSRHRNRGVLTLSSSFLGLHFEVVSLSHHTSSIEGSVSSHPES